MNKELAIACARAGGLRELPADVEQVRIRNRGENCCNEVVSREEFESVPSIPPGTYVLDHLVVTAELAWP